MLVTSVHVCAVGGVDRVGRDGARRGARAPARGAGAEPLRRAHLHSVLCSALLSSLPFFVFSLLLLERLLCSAHVCVCVFCVAQSGTTGNPKGVMISHDNVCSASLLSTSTLLRSRPSASASPYSQSTHSPATTHEPRIQVYG